MSTTPFPHQQQAIENLDKKLHGAKNKALVVLPSGSGKTHTIAFHVDRIKPKSFLYIVHRNEILFQSKKIFQDICGWDDSDIGVINTDFKQYDRKYLFGMVQTLGTARNLEKLSHDIEYVVLDEYHHSAADTYQRLLHYFRRVKRFVGLTATPYRLDEKDIMNYVNSNVAHNIDVFEGIQRKILVPFHYIGLYDDIDYTKIKYSGYRYKISDLDRKLIIHKRDEAVIEQYKQIIEPENRLTIGFCNSITHLNRITSKFRAAGIKAASVSYHENYKIRQQVIEDFKKGYYKVLFTRDILNEGVDFPECSAVMFLRPTISKVLFFQQLGRGLRLHPGKEDVVVLDFIGNYVRASEKNSWFGKAQFKRYTGRFYKPEYEHNVPVVEFDSNVLKIMELQKRFRTGEITKQDVFDDYSQCCLSEGVDFLSGKEYRKSKYRTLGIQHMHDLFHEFRFFLQEFNIIPDGGYRLKNYSNPHEGFNACTDKEKLIKNYYNVKKLWNDRKTSAEWRRKYLKGGGAGLPEGVPPAKLLDDFNVSSNAAICYSNTWGHYRVFLNEIGESKRKTLVTSDISFTRNSSKEEREAKLKIAVKRLQEHVGRDYFTQTQWREFMGGYAEKEIRDNYGQFKEFREHFGVPNGIPMKCEVCGKETLFTRENDTKTCSDLCYRKWVKKNRIDPKWQGILAKKAEEKIHCKFCGNETSAWTIFKGKKNGAKRKSFCNYKCQNRFNYYQRVGRDRPMSREERSKFVSEQSKSRWAKYSPEQKAHIIGVLRKSFVEKYPNHIVPATKETREKMSKSAKENYSKKHIVNGLFAKKDETLQDVKRKHSELAKKFIKLRKRTADGKFAGKLDEK